LFVDLTAKSGLPIIRSTTITINVQVIDLNQIALEKFAGRRRFEGKSVLITGGAAGMGLAAEFRVGTDVGFVIVHPQN